MTGTLYLVPTPIGNLEDITYRAVRILREVPTIACEDTRRTAILCRHYEINAHLVAYHEHNKQKAGAELLHRLQEGEDIALVSDAGMPAISDPGADIAREALAAGIQVVPLPGANAGLTALIASGLDTRTFHYIGFLPRTAAKRRETLESLREVAATAIFYEAPHRLENTLQAIYEIWGERNAVLARELTKKFESFYRGKLSDLLQSDIVHEPRGEFVILVAGYTPETLPADPAAWPAAVAKAMAAGANYKEACRLVAQQAGVSRREVYSYCLPTDERRK